MAPHADALELHITLSGDVYLKSRRTQQGLIQRVRANLTRALASVGHTEPLTRIGTHRFSTLVAASDVDAVRSAASLDAAACFRIRLETPLPRCSGHPRPFGVEILSYRVQAPVWSHYYFIETIYIVYTYMHVSMYIYREKQKERFRDGLVRLISLLYSLMARLFLYIYKKKCKQ